MTICYFGTYSPNYTRNKVNIAGLRENGVEVIECNVEPRGAESRLQKATYLSPGLRLWFSGAWVKTGGLRKHWDLFWKHRPLRGKYDVMIVGFNGHAVMPVAWLVTRFPRRKLVFDAFISAYDTNIFDRKKHSPHSLMALKYWLIDWLACNLADLVLMDAEAHAQYISETFHVTRKKVKGLLVGCPSDVMYPRPQNKTHSTSSGQVDSDFIVHFHGTYIPAQGIPYIIKAAQILDTFDSASIPPFESEKQAPLSINPERTPAFKLESRRVDGKGVKFNIIGKLDTYIEAINLAKQLNLTNVRFYDYMPYEKLAEFMANADICLGGFGDTKKAKMAGIFKIVEAMAMKKPFITANTPAMREFLTDKKDVLFCNSADSQDLADKIIQLKNDPILRNTIAENGYELYKQKFTPKAVGRDLLNMVSGLK